MTTDLYAAQNAALRRAFASLTASDPEAFTREALTVTARPEPSYFPFIAMIVGFGTGTVACFESRYVDWAKDNAPTEHDRAGYMVIALASEAKRRGEELSPFPPMLGWALARDRKIDAPTGYRLLRMEAGWMNEWQAKDIFTNALGSSPQAHRRFRNRFAYVLFDNSDQPVAAAGAYDSVGRLEIGVDVLPSHQGRGLAPIVVSATAHAIVDAGETPYYGCTVTNIRSQRTALASGFLPACSVAVAMPAGVGLD